MKVLSEADLQEKGIDYSGQHLNRLIRDGKFPKPIRLGPRRRAWPEIEIDNWLKAKIAERDGDTMAAA